MKDIATQLLELDKIKSDIKAALVSQGQDMTDVLFDQYAAKILAIEKGIDTSDATAIAANILSGKTAYVKGQKVTGSMPTISGSVALSRSGGTITGTYNPGQAGYKENTAVSNTLSLSTKSGTTITPGTSQKTAISSGYLATGNIYVAGSSNLVAGNIKSGVNIFGVIGNLAADDTYHVGQITVSNNSTSMTVPAPWKAASGIAINIGFSHTGLSGGSNTYAIVVQWTRFAGSSSNIIEQYNSQYGDWSGTIKATSSLTSATATTTSATFAGYSIGSPYERFGGRYLYILSKNNDLYW